MKWCYKNILKARENEMKWKMNSCKLSITVACLRYKCCFAVFDVLRHVYGWNTPAWKELDDTGVGHSLVLAPPSTDTFSSSQPLIPFVVVSIGAVVGSDKQHMNGTRKHSTIGIYVMESTRIENLFWGWAGCGTIRRFPPSTFSPFSPLFQWMEKILKADTGIPSVSFMHPSRLWCWMKLMFG